VGTDIGCIYRHRRQLEVTEPIPIICFDGRLSQMTALIRLEIVPLWLKDDDEISSSET
jgi:hypothetical protein